MSLAVGLLSLGLTAYGLRSLPSEPARLEATLLGETDLIGDLRAHQLPVRVEWDTAIGVEPAPPLTLTSLRVADLMIRNSGGQSLKWAYSVGAPLRIALGTSSRLLAVTRVEVGGSRTPPMKTVVELGRHAFTVETDFLDPGESLWLRLVYTGTRNALDIDQRVVGQGTLRLSRLPLQPTAPPAQNSIVLLSTLLFAALLPFVLVLRLAARRWRWWRAAAGAVIYSLFAVSLASAPVLWGAKWFGVTAIVWTPLLHVVLMLLLLAILYVDLPSRPEGTVLLTAVMKRSWRESTTSP